jgi:hypothetical protein
MHNFSELHPAPIRGTVQQLHRRIEERFPGSGLSRVAAELLRLAELNDEVLAETRRPLWWLRVAATVAIAAVLAIGAWIGLQVVRLWASGASIPDLLEGVDAATSELIVLALTVLFVTSIETRLKRRRALGMLHRLRSLAHVVDMHQLNKDPEHVLRPVTDTPSSPKRSLTHAQITRYLDYCSELLALTSKLAALHAQHLQDPVVLEAVNDIESLTAGLSRNIWQKITILERAHAVGGWPASPER